MNKIFFKIDTGADVTVIPECTYWESHDGPPGSVEPVQSYKEVAILKFPHLFSGLGKLEGAYTIALNEDAKPHALKCPEGLQYPFFQR